MFIVQAMKMPKETSLHKRLIDLMAIKVPSPPSPNIGEGEV